MFSLYLLDCYGRESRPADLYARLLVDAFPQDLDDADIGEHEPVDARGIAHAGLALNPRYTHGTAVLEKNMSSQRMKLSRLGAFVRRGGRPCAIPPVFFTCSRSGLVD